MCLSMIYYFIAAASISLHTYENIWCFFIGEGMKLTIFWHHQERCLDQKAFFFLKYSLNHKFFSMNHAMSWNKVKGNVSAFWTTPLVESCMTLTSLDANDLRFVQSHACSSMNWFTLGKVAWAVAQTPTVREHKLYSTMVFVSPSANLQNRTKAYARGGLGLTPPLSLIFYKNCITFARRLIVFT